MQKLQLHTCRTALSVSDPICEAYQSGIWCLVFLRTVLSTGMSRLADSHSQPPRQCIGVEDWTCGYKEVCEALARSLPSIEYTVLMYCDTTSSSPRGSRPLSEGLLLFTGGLPSGLTVSSWGVVLHRSALLMSVAGTVRRSIRNQIPVW